MGGSAAVNLIPVSYPIISASDVEGYCQRKLDMSLTISQSVLLRRLVVGLIASEKTTGNGKRVESAPDAVRWLIEQVDPDAARSVL